MEMLTELPVCDEFMCPVLRDDVLTMAFVNVQPDPDAYEPGQGYMRGTIFPALDKPLSVGGLKR